MFAMAAMSRNRVIGNGGDIPWRVPEEFKWFRQMTSDRVVIMGRRTFESLPKPLVGRVNVVLTRHPGQLRKDERFRSVFAGATVGTAAHRLRDVVQLNFPQTPRTQIRLVRGMDSLERSGISKEACLCGGAQVYEQFLPMCSVLYLSVIKREVEGDTFFPSFEHLFKYCGVLKDYAEFQVLRYERIVSCQDDAEESGEEEIGGLVAVSGRVSSHPPVAGESDRVRY
jgi:dihydrofolate reductase